MIPKGGRPRGARNRLQRKFLEALTADFELHGEAVIRVVRHESPETYLKIVAGIMPREILASSEISDLSDDEIDGLIDQLRDRVIAARTEQALELPAEQPQLIEVKAITNGKRTN